MRLCLLVGRRGLHRRRRPRWRRCRRGWRRLRVRISIRRGLAGFIEGVGWLVSWLMERGVKGKLIGEGQKSFSKDIGHHRMLS